MKVTAGRIRVLQALAKDGAFAYPDGRIPGDLHGMPAGIEEVLRNGKFIAEHRPPKGVSVSYVWRITEKGLAWLESALTSQAKG